MSAVSAQGHETGVCVTPLRKYLGSGPPELYSQFHLKAERLSSLETRIVPDVTLSREVVRGVCAPEPACPGPALGPAVPRCDCAGWFMSLCVSVLICWLGQWCYCAGGLSSGLKKSILVRCLTRCMMSVAILTPNIGHGKKRLFAMWLADRSRDRWAGREKEGKEKQWARRRRERKSSGRV